MLSRPTKPIPYARQTVSTEDIAAVSRVLAGDRLTQGPEVERFEQAVARYCGVAEAVAVSSGTAALHIARPPDHGVRSLPFSASYCRKVLKNSPSPTFV